MIKPERTCFIIKMNKMTFFNILVILAIIYKISSLQISLNLNEPKDQLDKYLLVDIQSSFYDSTPQDFTGRYFTTEVINLIKGNITQAEIFYNQSQLANISAYVAQAMTKRNPVNKYSVFVYDNTTDHVALYLDQDFGAHLWWIKFGKYQLTYVIDVRTGCKNMGASGALSSFGQEVKQTDKDWLTEIVNNSALYRGDNVLDAANYIYLKIYEKYGRYYKVYVSSPSTELGFFQCRTGQYWAYFKNFTERKWSYYIVRSQKA